MEEIWKDVPSVPQVMASNYGRLKLKPYSYVMHNGGVRHYNPKPRTGRPMKSSTGREGAPKRLMIYYYGLKRAFNVARLVCEAFNGPPTKEKPICMHLDEDPSNNRPENLRWGTQKENLNMPIVQAYFKNRTGENSCRRKGMNKIKKVE